MKHHFGLLVSVVMLVVAGVVVYQAKNVPITGLMDDGTGLQHNVLCTDPELCSSSSSVSSIDLCPDIDKEETIFVAHSADAEVECNKVRKKWGKGDPDRCGPGCMVHPNPSKSNETETIVKSVYNGTMVKCTYDVECIVASGANSNEM